MRIPKPTALIVVALAVLVALVAKRWQITMAGGVWFVMQQALASALYLTALAAAAVIAVDRLVTLKILAVKPPTQGALVMSLGVALVVIIGLAVAANATSANVDAPGWARGLSFSLTALSDLLSIMAASLLATGVIGALNRRDEPHPLSKVP